MSRSVAFQKFKTTYNRFFHVKVSFYHNLPNSYPEICIPQGSSHCGVYTGTLWTRLNNGIPGATPFYKGLPLGMCSVLKYIYLSALIHTEIHWKVFSHQIRSAWKWYVWISLVGSKNRGWSKVFQNMIDVACNLRIPQANMNAELNFVPVPCIECRNWVSHIWNFY